MSNQQTYMIINQGGNEEYSLAIRGRKVVVALYNPRDPYQRWIKKDNGTKDQEGQPAFILINEATNEAIKHEGTTGPMSLVQYDTVASSQDNSVLWSESKDSNQGFRYIRRASNISRHITVNYHALREGRIVDLWYETDITEHWKFIPYSKDLLVPNQQTITISCRSKEGYNLTISDDTVMLARADPKDKNQIWVKEISYAKPVKDKDGKQAFALVNKATGKAIKHGFGTDNLVHLAQFNQNYLDSSLLWTESEKELGFKEIRMQSNTSAVFHASYVDEADSNKALLELRLPTSSNDQLWKFQEITLWDAGDASTTTPEKPSNQWDSSKADIFFDGSKN
ncbi:hypothetical protein LUZ61_009539 [Rhynchospora tenuis]|uniref:Uncharacterized protein n=1 Tax=Rhynchospora tenuis TaxID=198213 RepID=A0AAD6EYI1_9POAL|nr:hypothetical protein LUZ61_009539 [Rhynchospora tenuis]